MDENKKIEHGLDEVIKIMFGKTAEELQKSLENCSRPKVLNLDVVRNMDRCVKIMERLTAETGCKAKIKSKQTDVLATIGEVTVEGASIDMINMEAFASIRDLCDNMEVYPLADGRVRLTFGFYDMLQTI